MSKADWFRRTTWSPADEAEFLARVKRSRTEFHRAQYLRIQAWHLAESGDPTLLVPAVKLLDLLITEHPDRSQLSLAHHQRATCLVDMGEVAEALNGFRSALAARSAYPGVESDAHLDFGEVVCALKRTDLFAEVAAALDEFGSVSPFPAHV